MTSPKNKSLTHAKFQLKETTFEGISYIYPTWDQMGRFNFDLAKQINTSGQSFDRIIALARGGWTWARDLSDGLKISEISSIRIKSYTNVNESQEPKIVQPLTDAITGESILLFDEVIDSGETIKKAKEYIKVMGAKKVQIAALCYKPRSIIKPDFFAFSTDVWVVFPHEIREFVEGCSNKWKSAGVSNKEIKKRCIKIGIPPEQVTFYCSGLK